MAIAISERLFHSPFEGPISLLGAEVKIISDISKTDQGRVHQFGTEGIPGMIPLELVEGWTGDLLTMPPSEIHVKKGSNQQKWKFTEESVNLYSHTGESCKKDSRYLPQLSATFSRRSPRSRSRCRTRQDFCSLM